MFLIFNLLILIQFFQPGVSSTPAVFAWENRLILINGDGDCSSWFDEGLLKDLSDRKLLVFHFNEGFLLGSNFEGKRKTTDFLNPDS